MLSLVMSECLPFPRIQIAIIEQSALRKIAWEYLVIDEAHRIKNENSTLSGVRSRLHCVKLAAVFLLIVACCLGRSHVCGWPSLAADGYSSSKQPARAVGASQLLAA